MRYSGNPGRQSDYPPHVTELITTAQRAEGPLPKEHNFYLFIFKYFIYSFERDRAGEHKQGEQEAEEKQTPHRAESWMMQGLTPGP